MKSPLFLPSLALILLTTLAGCTSQPPAPTRPPVYYDGRVKPALFDELGRIRVSPGVPHPTHTRYASIGSRLPFYGMLMPDKPGAVQAPFGEFALAPVLDVAAVTTGEFRRQLAALPALAGRFGDNGQARLQIDIIRISIFGKDVGNTLCEPLVLLRARIADASGRVRWSSGITGNRPDERIGYACQDIERQREVAARAIGEAMSRAVATVIARM